MSEEQQRLFLRELQYSGNVAFACHAAGVDRRTAYEFRHATPMFEKMWRRATENARSYLAQRIGGDSA